MNLKLSVLDLTPIAEGSSSAETLQQSCALAQQVDRLGYVRYWFSEHHNTNMLASASPEILVGHIAQQTRSLRVGTGGIMLPNHQPLKVAETFRLLSTLYPERIDLGLGRAPGTDLQTAYALRGTLTQGDDFPQQLQQLWHYLHENTGPIQAIPLDAPATAVWLLGSSNFSAQLAARLGLPFAFAHHIQPEPAQQALALYQAQFQPSSVCAHPQNMLAVSVICAETDEEASALAQSADLMWLRFRSQQGRPGPLPSLATAQSQVYSDAERQIIAFNRQRMFVGSPERLRSELGDLAKAWGVQELMVSTLVHDPQARQRSYALLAAAFSDQKTASDA